MEFRHLLQEREFPRPPLDEDGQPILAQTDRLAADGTTYDGGFDPVSDKYWTSLILLGVPFVLALLLTLFIFCMYGCYRGCCKLSGRDCCPPPRQKGYATWFVRSVQILCIIITGVSFLAAFVAAGSGVSVVTQLQTLADRAYEEIERFVDLSERAYAVYLTGLNIIEDRLTPNLNFRLADVQRLVDVIRRMKEKADDHRSGVWTTFTVLVSIIIALALAHVILELIAFFGTLCQRRGLITVALVLLPVVATALWSFSGGAYIFKVLTDDTCTSMGQLLELPTLLQNRTELLDLMYCHKVDLTPLYDNLEVVDELLDEANGLLNRTNDAVDEFNADNPYEVQAPRVPLVCNLYQGRLDVTSQQCEQVSQEDPSNEYVWLPNLKERLLEFACAEDDQEACLLLQTPIVNTISTDLNEQTDAASEILAILPELIALLECRTQLGLLRELSEDHCDSMQKSTRAMVAGCFMVGCCTIMLFVVWTCFSGMFGKPGANPVDQMMSFKQEWRSSRHLGASGRWSGHPPPPGHGSSRHPHPEDDGGYGDHDVVPGAQYMEHPHQPGPTVTLTAHPSQHGSKHLRWDDDPSPPHDADGKYPAAPPAMGYPHAHHPYDERHLPHPSHAHGSGGDAYPAPEPDAWDAHLMAKGDRWRGEEGAGRAPGAPPPHHHHHPSLSAGAEDVAPSAPLSDGGSSRMLPAPPGSGDGGGWGEPVMPPATLGSRGVQHWINPPPEGYSHQDSMHSQGGSTGQYDPYSEATSEDRSAQMAQRPPQGRIYGGGRVRR